MSIEGEITIGRPVDVVFDYVADQTNEPRYNPAIVRAEKQTSGPIGTGTRFASTVRSAGRTAEMLIETTSYDGCDGPEQCTRRARSGCSLRW